MASKKKSKSSRSEYLLKGLSARYQNYTLTEIQKMYKPNDRFKLEKDVSAEDKERFEDLRLLVSSYGAVLKDDLQYKNGVKIPIKWEAETVSEEQKKKMGRVQSTAKKIMVFAFTTAQKAILQFGYNYCGSGTPIAQYLLEGKPPSTELDFLCMKHDIAYLAMATKGLSTKQLNAEVRKADNLLQKEASDIQSRLKEQGLEGSRLHADATVVISAMKAKKGLENVNIFGASSFIDPIPQIDEVNLRNASKASSGRSLVSEFNAQNTDDLLKNFQADGTMKGIDVTEFKNTATALLALDEENRTPSYLIFDSERSKDATFQAQVQRENEFLKNSFGDDDKDIDEFAKLKPVTSMSEKMPTYGGQTDPIFKVGEQPDEPLGEGAFQAEEEQKDDPTGEDPEEPPPPRAEPGEDGEELIDPSDPVKETPINLDELRNQRDRVGQEERVDLKADPPMSAMAMTDAKPVIGERNMRPTLFREEGDTVKLSNAQEQENRLFYENFTWIDAGFGNGNIQRIPGEAYAGKDIANNRLYDAQVKNEMLKYSGDLFVGTQQYRKKYNVSQQTRNLVRRPMFSTVQHHQQFIRDSSLPAGAGRYHQMARDNPSWIPSKNVNSKVGHLFYPDVVDGQRL